MERELYAAVAGTGAGASQTCGNGSVEGNEVCDDGNVVSGDGCSSSCLSDESCGNSIYDSGEECDDGNTTDGDGCSSGCQFEEDTTVCPSSSGGGSAPLGIYNAVPHQIDETTVMITWNTNMPATARVVYGTDSAVNYGTSPNYTYPNSTVEDSDKSLFHSITITDLEPGVMYYFRPISNIGAGNDILGEEINITPLFTSEKITEYVDRIEYIDRIVEVPAQCPVVETGTGECPTVQCPAPSEICEVIKGEGDAGTEPDGRISQPRGEVISGGTGIPGKISIIKINNKVLDTFLYDKFGVKFIEITDTRNLIFYGTGVPDSKFKLMIY
ncbi:MAG: DUF4215 domain-containing protein [Candidatus Magasanikbacteria bacterium]|nr:DUF4215 domain-containing protein [Candidatus Magasanikbacteria bacterium]